ncbi:MAG TPA: hypothetical protein PKM25_08700 [Candidatus Ozemobacteraceae bacterium]|nr:hypothetical protein [Candidatus Ozemobacteraceae bacterium]
MKTPLILCAVACLLAGPVTGQIPQAASVTYDISLPPVQTPAPTIRQLAGIAEMQLAVADTFLKVWQGRLDLMQKELARLDARVKSGLLQADDPVRSGLRAKISSAEGRVDRLRKRQMGIQNEYQLALRAATQAVPEKVEPASVASESELPGPELPDHSVPLPEEFIRYPSEGFSHDVASPSERIGSDIDTP